MRACEKLPGVIFVMIGPGGAGKNAIMKAVIAEFSNVRQLATATTRQMRSDEAQGREHLFLSQAEFARMIECGDLLEYQEVTPGKFYGIPRQSIADALASGAVRIADIDVLGAKVLAQAFKDNVIQLYITVPGVEMAEQLEVLRQRMRARADQFTDIEERLERAKTLELPYKDECDYVVVNDDLAQAVSRTRAIVKRELKARGLQS
ncbi:MAG: hypothetical protein OXG78_04345 [Chloroflexi bacterium]|nr:hypothetical protein [Chloroflexota bacterium]